MSPYSEARTAGISAGYNITFPGSFIYIRCLQLVIFDLDDRWPAGARPVSGSDISIASFVLAIARTSL